MNGDELNNDTPNVIQQLFNMTNPRGMGEGIRSGVDAVRADPKKLLYAMPGVAPTVMGLKGIDAMATKGADAGLGGIEKLVELLAGGYMGTPQADVQSAQPQRTATPPQGQGQSMDTPPQAPQGQPQQSQPQDPQAALKRMLEINFEMEGKGWSDKWKQVARGKVARHLMDQGLPPEAAMNWVALGSKMFLPQYNEPAGGMSTLDRQKTMKLLEAKHKATQNPKWIKENKKRLDALMKDNVKATSGTLPFGAPPALTGAGEIQVAEDIYGAGSSGGSDAALNKELLDNLKAVTR